MKKIILTLAAAAMVAGASAQDKKMWIGGSLGVLGDNWKASDGAVIKPGKDKASSFTFSIMPEIGYRLNDKVAIALRFGMNLTNYNETTTNGIDFTEDEKENARALGFMVAPFVRFNAVKLGDKVTLFVDGCLGYGHTKYSDRAVVAGYRANGSMHSNSFAIGIRPGISVALTHAVALTATFGQLGYQNEHFCKRSTDVSNWGLSMSSENLSFGASFNF